MRRLYRPGAPLPVKIYFPVYEDTLEEDALNLIGSKMMAAQCFYGDDVGGALVEEGDDATADLINDLVRQALGELQVGRADSLFSASNNQAGAPDAVPMLPPPADLARSGDPQSVSTPPVPAPVTPGASLADLWQQRKALLKARPEQGRRAKRKSPTFTDQLPLL